MGDFAKASRSILTSEEKKYKQTIWNKTLFTYLRRSSDEKKTKIHEIGPRKSIFCKRGRQYCWEKKIFYIVVVIILWFVCYNHSLFDFAWEWAK